MVRTVAPGTPQSNDVKLQKIPRLDFSAFEKMGDAQIKAGLTNAKLYAQNLLSTEQQKLFEQYSADPIMLSNALGKLPDMISDLPQEVQDEMNLKLYTSNIGLVQKAQNNQLVLQDQQNKAYADQNINDIRATILENYTNVMKNAMSPADMKNNVANDIFLSQVDDLQTMSAIKDHNGKDIYSDTQKKAILNVSDTQLEAGKQFVDQMILNDDDELSQTKDYYQKFVLAPERFMADNYMNRKTYDDFRAYVEKQMKQAGADIKNMRHKQTMAQAMSLQMDNAPGTLEELRKSGWIDGKIVDQIEKTNVKFNELDPSKTETPIAMLDLLQIVNSWTRLPDDATEEQRMLILAEGTAALDGIADYAQKYGLSPDSVKRARQMIVMKEQDVLYGQLFNNFGMITQSFGSEIPDMEKKMNFIRGISTGNLKGVDYVVPTEQEMIKLGKLSEVLAVATDMSREAIRTGDTNAYNQIQANLRKQVAQIKYNGVIKGYMWEEYARNPDYTFVLDDGTSFQIAGFTATGDIATK